MTGIPPRLLMLGGALVVATWLLLAFGRQLGAASVAAERADALRAENARLESEVEALGRELERIADPRYIALVARGYRLGSPDEIPFTLGADPPALPADAPGSAAARLGADEDAGSALDSWLTLLFGPGG
jgi:cell division protein FtsB